MTDRVVAPEILDSLAADDPEARRSRRDLRRLNRLMGNHRWLSRRVARHAGAAARGVVELGAGDGTLVGRLAPRFPVTAVDLAPRPTGVPKKVRWLQCDLSTCSGELGGGMLLANLFLHHLDRGQLAALGRLAGRFEFLCVCEPWRTGLAHGLARLMRPWVGPVTRHDMHVSIAAGFRRGELGKLLGLDRSRWSLRESVDLRGSIRLVARRRA